MPQSNARRAMIARLTTAAASDPRIVGMLDYGSGSHGRVDEWSDIDVEVFVRDEDYDAFARDWKEWAAGFGTLLLAYVGHIGHPWTVYDTEPVPLRVDFDLVHASDLEQVVTWPTSPTSVEAMVLYDGTGGRLSSLIAGMVGRSLAPEDLHATFDEVNGDFWYYLLYVLSKLGRGDHRVAREVYHLEPLITLARLLRMEAGALDRWRGSPGTFNLDRTVSAARVAWYQRCIPGPEAATLAPAALNAASLGGEVCATIARQHGWPWPDRLAERTAILAADLAVRASEA